MDKIIVNTPRMEVTKGKIEIPLYPNRVITDLTIDDDSIEKWDYIQM